MYGIATRAQKGPGKVRGEGGQAGQVVVGRRTLSHAMRLNLPISNLPICVNVKVDGLRGVCWRGRTISS